MRKIIGLFLVFSLVHGQGELEAQSQSAPTHVRRQAENQTAQEHATQPTDEHTREQNVVERTWTDASGKRKVRATLLGFEGRNGRFRKSSGSIVRVPMSQLSAADRKFIALRQVPNLAQHFAKLGETLADGIRVRPGTSIEMGKAAWGRFGSNDATKLGPPPRNVVYVRVSEAFLERHLCRDVVRESPVAETILGTAVYGTAHTIGKTTFRLVPSKTRGLADLRFTGITRSTTVGFNGPVQIHSQSDTTFHAHKQLRFNLAKAMATPARTTASTSSTIDNITSSLPRLRGRIAVAIARRRAGAQLATSELIAAQRAASRITTNFDEAVAKQLNELSNMVAEQLMAVRSDQSPTTARFSTTDEYLQVVLISPEGDRWADEPPWLVERSAVEIHIHSEAISTALTDATLKRQVGPLLHALTGRLAVEAVLLRVNDASDGEQDYDPQIDVRWSDDRQWLTLVWRGSEAKQQITETNVRNSPRILGLQTIPPGK